MNEIGNDCHQQRNRAVNQGLFFVSFSLLISNFIIFLTFLFIFTFLSYSLTHWCWTVRPDESKEMEWRSREQQLSDSNTLREYDFILNAVGVILCNLLRVSFGVPHRFLGFTLSAIRSYPLSIRGDTTLLIF
jgi:hypothetical protein